MTLSQVFPFDQTSHDASYDLSMCVSIFQSPSSNQCHPKGRLPVAVSSLHFRPSFLYYHASFDGLQGVFRVVQWLLVFIYFVSVIGRSSWLSLYRPFFSVRLSFLTSRRLLSCSVFPCLSVSFRVHLLLSVSSIWLPVCHWVIPPFVRG